MDHKILLIVSGIDLDMSRALLDLKKEDLIIVDSSDVASVHQFSENFAQTRHIPSFDLKDVELTEIRHCAYFPEPERKQYKPYRNKMTKGRR